MVAENADEAAVAAMSTPAPVEWMWQSMSQRALKGVTPEQQHMARHLFFAGAISMQRLFDALPEEETDEGAIKLLEKIKQEMELYKTMTNAEVREAKAKAG